MFKYILAALTVMALFLLSMGSAYAESFTLSAPTPLDLSAYAGSYEVNVKSSFLKKTSHGDLSGTAAISYDPEMTSTKLEGTYQRLSVQLQFGTVFKTRCEVLKSNQLPQTLMSYKSHWISLTNYATAKINKSTFIVSQDSDGEQTEVILNLENPEILKIQVTYLCCKWDMGPLGCGRMGKCHDQYQLRRQHESL